MKNLKTFENFEYDDDFGRFNDEEDFNDDGNWEEEDGTDYRWNDEDWYDDENCPSCDHEDDLDELEGSPRSVDGDFHVGKFADFEEDEDDDEDWGEEDYGTFERKSNRSIAPKRTGVSKRTVAPKRRPSGLFEKKGAPKKGVNPFAKKEDEKGKRAPKDEKETKETPKKGLTAAQKKLPKALQDSILKKQK